MKVAFIGTHGVRKTTLAHKLFVKLKEREIISEVLKEVAGTCPLEINEKASRAAQEWIIGTQITRELELEDKLKSPYVLICDRSVFDNYTYFYNLFGHDDEYRALVQKKIATYDLLFKVQLTKRCKLQNDGVRSLNEEFQMVINEKMDRLITEMNVPVVKYKNFEDCLERVLKQYHLHTN